MAVWISSPGRAAEEEQRRREVEAYVESAVRSDGACQTGKH
jgi:hypothetical protein